MSRRWQDSIVDFTDDETEYRRAAAAEPGRVVRIGGGAYDELDVPGEGEL